jgi:hypothetical protein
MIGPYFVRRLLRQIRLTIAVPTVATGAVVVPCRSHSDEQAGHHQVPRHISPLVEKGVLHEIVCGEDDEGGPNSSTIIHRFSSILR